MSGHSKWSQIKHKKGQEDQKRGLLFGKLAKAIQAAAKEGPDPDTNIRLQSAIERAQAHDMPKGSIERILKNIRERKEDVFELLLEAIGPGGTAILVAVITDNKNRAISNIRLLLSKHGARLVPEGSLMWAFKRQGLQYIPQTSVILAQEDSLRLKGLLEDLNACGDVQEVFNNAE